MNSVTANLNYPSIYFTTLWLKTFNKNLILERMDLVEEYIQESYNRFIVSQFNDYSLSELDAIENYLACEASKSPSYQFVDK